MEKMGPKRDRSSIRPEVKEAVNDIIHGKTVDSHTEWLQREYFRLMKREAEVKMNESKLRQQQQRIQMAQDGNIQQNRSAEQHGAKSDKSGAVLCPQDDD